MSYKLSKFIVATALILLIVSTIFRISAATVWTEYFDDLDDWDLSDFTINAITEVHTQDNVSGFSLVDGALTAPNCLNWNHPSRALRNSTVAYGTWSFDWVVAEGSTHKAHDGVLFIHTDREHNYNINGLTQAEYYAGLSGYVLVLSCMQLSGVIVGPGLTIVEYTTQEPGYEVLGSHPLSTAPVGPHHIDITRNSQGIFRVFFDSSQVIQVTDNSITTSEKFGFKSFRGDSQIDNITVSDSVDKTPAPASISITVVVLGLMVLPLVAQKRKKR
ncbi:MAG: hypothetical protein ACXACK_13530 [Candidatus Hodarchaeales archaeon]|jgi:hypothetical protein